MSEPLLRCPSCAATITSSAAASCQWCGAPLPRPAAPTALATPTVDPTQLARALAAEEARLVGSRRGYGRLLGAFFGLLVVAAIVAVALLSFSVRVDGPPATEQSESTNGASSESSHSGANAPTSPPVERSDHR